MTISCTAAMIAPARSPEPAPLLRGEAEGSRGSAGERSRESRNYVGVELPPSVPLELADRRGWGENLAVGTLGRHGVESVADEGDARGERDLLAGEPVWIAAAVEPLVARADEGGDLLERRRREQDPLADQGVPADEGLLL